MRTIHVAGAGLAGLAAAMAAVEAGARVVVYEAARHAGGRCRSFDDPVVGRRIDNGNHLVLSGNRATLGYVDALGVRDRLVEVRPASFPFVDLADGERWAIRPGPAWWPLWPLEHRRRPPGVRAREFAAGLALLRAGPDQSVGDVVSTSGAAFRRFWEPFVVGVLNTDAESAAAALLRPVILETLARGEHRSRPLIARTGLSDALVEPAVEWLRRQGAVVHFGARLEALDLTADGARALRVGGTSVALEAGDQIVVALPPWETASLLTCPSPPMGYSPILNAHFRVPGGGVTTPTLLGVVGGLAQWIICREDVASVTVSAADAVIDTPPAALAERLWPEVVAALGLAPAPLGPSRIVKERRATIRQTPAAVAAKWSAKTRWPNVTIAGEATDTGLPATIEAAIRSGHHAVKMLHAL
ncbi:MAG: hydroxysqualene dehydroxylase HpnE [Pseudomonadota bacterium]